MSAAPDLDPPPEIRLVTTQAELDAAWAELAAGGGGTLLLAAGPAYTLRARDTQGSQETPPITLASADPANPASFAWVKLSKQENITFDGVVFEASRADLSAHQHLVEIYDSRDIAIVNSRFASDAAGPFGTQDGFAQAASALLVRGSDGVTIEGNTVASVYHGFMFMDSYDIAVTGNDLSGFQGDGIRIAGVTGMQVDANHLHDPIGSTQAVNHSDMIQFWGYNIQVNNADIAIRGNILDTGSGPGYQMIFGGNEHRHLNGFQFENFVIEHNLIVGGHFHAISVSDTLNMTVRHNTVLPNPEAHEIHADGSMTLLDMSPTIRAFGHEGAVIEHNVAPQIYHSEGFDNLVLGADVGALFVNPEAGASGDLRDLAMYPDSPFHGVMGSALTWRDFQADGLVAMADVSVPGQDLSVVTLDARLSHGPDGILPEATTLYEWHFADGTVLTGPVVQHDFDTPGRHDYSLRVVGPDGATDEITRSVAIANPVALDLQIADGALVCAAGQPIGAVSASIDGDWIVIGGEDKVTLGRDNPGFFDLDAFQFQLTLDPVPGAAGVFLHLHQTITAQITDDGRVQVDLQTDAGAFSLTGATAVFADDGAHDLVLVYDGTQELLSLYIDGQADAVIVASGSTAGVKHWGLTLGNTWDHTLEARMRDVWLSREPGEFPEMAFEDASTKMAEPNAEARYDAPDLDLTLDPLSEDPEPLFDPAQDAATFLFLDAADRGDGDIAVLDLSAQGAQITARGAAPDWIERADGGLALGLAAGSSLMVDRDHDMLFDRDAFGISFDLQSDLDTAYRVLGIHQSMRAQIVEGDFVFRLRTTEGAVTLRSDGAIFADHDWHSVEIGFDAEAGGLALWIDGALADMAAASGSTLPAAHWGLMVGSHWEPQGFDGAIDDLHVTAHADPALFQSPDLL